jgi:hypothetical protein
MYLSGFFAQVANIDPVSPEIFTYMILYAYQANKGRFDWEEVNVRIERIVVVSLAWHHYNQLSSGNPLEFCHSFTKMSNMLERMVTGYNIKGFIGKGKIFYVHLMVCAAHYLYMV